VSYKSAKKILRDVYKVLKDAKNIIEVETQKDGRVHVVKQICFLAVLSHLL